MSKDQSDNKTYHSNQQDHHLHKYNQKAKNFKSTFLLNGNISNQNN
ncbi:unnamed protein product [Paramecium sonneborni]|uniref:Uncharacterized protein n=1 Tax=Paramecium sonneborni TaxID=65129 RepID=A0A8S1LDV2_9CILI|nr:unnamed protein product [Paramecium sonneborni]